MESLLGLIIGLDGIYGHVEPNGWGTVRSPNSVIIVCTCSRGPIVRRSEHLVGAG
jgi:hypothetical protein